MIRSLVLLVTTLAALACAVGCSTSSRPLADGIIDASGGELSATLENGERVRIVVPAGSVSAATTFGILDLGAIDAPNGQVGLSHGIQLLPEGQAFAHAITVEWTLAQAPTSLLTRAHGASAWQVVATSEYDTSTQTLHASLTHFSDFLPVMDSDPTSDGGVGDDGSMPIDGSSDAGIPDGSAPGDSGPRSDASIPVECPWAIDLAAVTTPDSDGSIHYSASTAGGSDRTAAACGDIRYGSPDGNDIAFMYVPSTNGVAIVDVIGSDEEIDFYVRRDCMDPATEMSCLGSWAGNLWKLPVLMERGVPVYIMVSAQNPGATRNITLNIVPMPTRDEGEACDPSTSLSARCSNGLLCAGASPTCQAGVDLGCGVGTHVVDLTSRIVGNHITYSDTTSFSTNTRETLCHVQTQPVNSGWMGGPWGGPENIHSFVLPVDAQISVTATGTEFFSPDIELRTDCLPDHPIALRSCTVPDWPGHISSVTANAGGRFSAGTRVYVVIDASGYYGGVLQGSYTLDINIEPTAHAGDACSSGTAGPHCSAGLFCAAMGFEDSCRANVCGDAVVEGDESCEDGNAASGDGCNACVLEDPGLGAGACDSATPIKLARVTSRTRAANAWGLTTAENGYAYYTFTLDHAQHLDVSFKPFGHFYAHWKITRGCSSLAEQVASAGTPFSGTESNASVDLSAGTYYFIVFPDGYDGDEPSSRYGDYHLQLLATDP